MRQIQEVSKDLGMCSGLGISPILSKVGSA
jgi:hypothetical protein